VHPRQAFVRPQDIDAIAGRLGIGDLVIEEGAVGAVAVGAPERAVLFEDEQRAGRNGAKFRDRLRELFRILVGKAEAPEPRGRVQPIGERAADDGEALDAGAERLARRRAIIERRAGIQAIEQFGRFVLGRGGRADMAPAAATPAARIEDDFAGLGEIAADPIAAVGLPLERMGGGDGAGERQSGGEESQKRAGKWHGKGLGWRAGQAQRIV
jgi:hypothetical protein